MTSRPRFALSTSLLPLGLSIAIAIPAFAFEYPLSSTSIREAYMLGNRKDFKTTEFFTQYTHTFPKPEKGAHIATIGVETPYGQVVEMGEAALNADTQGAEQDLAGKEFPFFVRVGVNLTDTYRCRISSAISKSAFRKTSRFFRSPHRCACSIPMRSRIFSGYQEL
jgi:hypothetical protein